MNFLLIKLLIAVKAKEDQQVSSASTNCPAQDHTWQLVVTQSKLVGSVDSHKLNLQPSFRRQSSPPHTTDMSTPDIFTVDLEAQLQNGVCLSRPRLNRLVRELAARSGAPTNYSSHSFRIGAASAATAAGIPKWQIQALGRWSTDCYKRYIRLPSSTTDTVATACLCDQVSSIEPTLNVWGSPYTTPN